MILRLTYQSVLFFAFCFLLSSCQKEVDLKDPLPEPDPNPSSFDSTRLLKSLSYDLQGIEEMKEVYSYDTINRKITLFFEKSEVLPGVTAVFSYTADHLLTGIQYTYPAGHVSVSGDHEHMRFKYDADKVLSEVGIKKKGESEAITVFTKTAIPAGGYQLEWVTNEDGFMSNFQLRTVFNTQRRPILEYTKYSYETGLGITQKTIADSLVYDNTGSVQKIFRRVTDSLRHEQEEFLATEFSQREAQGMELFLQRELLLGKGMDFAFIGEGELGLGIFGIFLGSDEQRQYFRNPIGHAKIIHNSPDVIQEFDATSVFDGKGRLITYNGFTHDTELIPTKYILEYYK